VTISLFELSKEKLYF